MQNSKGNSEIGEKHKISDGMPHLQDLIKKFEAFHKKTQNEIDNAAIALVDNHVHFNNNGYGKTHASASNIRYASFTSNGYVQDYANSTNNFRDLYDWPINGGYNNDNAFATNNGYKYNTDCTYSNGFVSRAQPKVYLPLVDSSIVSMVPPPSFLKGIGNFTITSVARHNARVAQTNSSAKPFSTPPKYSSKRLHRKHNVPMPEVVNIMLYVNDDSLFEQFVGKEKPTMIDALHHSRLLKIIMKNNVNYLSPEVYESIEKEVSVIMKENQVSPCNEFLSYEDEDKDSMCSDVKTVVNSSYEEDITVSDVKSLSPAMVEPVVEEQPETFEDSLESSDEKPDFDETKNTSISTFMVGAEKAFQSLPPNICEFYRSASFDEIKQHLDEQWKFNLSCECCHERPIHFAVRYCHDLLNILSSVTEIDLPNKSGETALHVACEMNSLDAVVYLLSRGADPLKKNAKGETCLYVCQRQKYTSLAKTILQTMDIQSIKEFPEDHMVVAAREGSVDFVKLFLKFKANINYLDKDGNSATSLAVQLGHKDILVLLLKNKANIKQTYMTEGNSLLHIACKHDQEVSVKELLEAGASVHAVNCFRETPLHIAALCSSLNIVRMLLASNSDIDAKDCSMHTPLYKAIIQNKLLPVKFLLSNGASTKSIVAPFMLAIKNKHYSMVKLLVSYGFHTDEQGQLCQNLFDAAIEEGSMDLINLWYDVKSRRDL